MTTAVLVLIILACLAVSAFFSGSETALFRLRGHELQEEVEAARGPSAVAVRDLIESSSRLLVTILLGNNIVNILGASVASALAVSWFGARIGIPIATLVMTVLVLVLCEVLPKAVAARHPLGVSLLVGLPLYILHKMLRPLHVLFDKVIEPVVRKITGDREGEDPLSSEEVLRLARRAREDGDNDRPLAIIGATGAAAAMTVEEIMVPRTEIEAHPADLPAPDLLEQLLEERYTRIPIYDEDIDHVLGLVHLKDLVGFVRDGGTSVRQILKPILRVPERKPILSLLTDMQRALSHMALVKDEFGVTLGLVTQEDILEEIVGEIRDEFDSEELLEIRRLADGSYEVLGRVSVRDFNRESGWQIPAEKGDTLGGLVFNTIGRAARKGESVTVPGYKLACVDVSGSRIARVRVSEEPAEELASTG